MFYVVSEDLFMINIKRKMNKRLIYECRCDERLKAKAEGDERLKAKAEGSTRLTH